jgi:hypothetical protein
MHPPHSDLALPSKAPRPSPTTPRIEVWREEVAAATSAHPTAVPPAPLRSWQRLRRRILRKTRGEIGDVEMRTAEEVGELRTRMYDVGVLGRRRGREGRVDEVGGGEGLEEEDGGNDDAGGDGGREGEGDVFDSLLSEEESSEGKGKVSQGRKLTERLERLERAERLLKKRRGKEREREKQKGEEERVKSDDWSGQALNMLEAGSRSLRS